MPAIFFSFAFKIKRKENSKRESAGQAHEQQILVLRFVFMRFALLNGGIRVFVVHGIPYISVCCFMRSAKSFVCFPVPPPATVRNIHVTGYTTDRQRSPSTDIDLITIDSFQCIHHNFGHYLAQLLSFPLMQWKNMM
ncbi:hypothetical protein [Bifidobacterium longum]|uniref:hypothetical protein n=1 Tax=Bifidobacterium longum TaxID=216816 RepID=UPI001A9031D2|nr:hypothetical protein [Bifidobacterium longum]